MFLSWIVPSNDSGPAGCVDLELTEFNEASDDWFPRTPSQPLELSAALTLIDG